MKNDNMGNTRTPLPADLYPLRFNPVYKNYIWGGDNIRRYFQRAAPPGLYAESWEVTDRSEGESVVLDGPWAGHSLHEMLAAWGPALLGSAVPGDTFPLLVKILDAHQRLSLQVHPDDAAARRFGGEPKTELWYILRAAPGARVWTGLRPGVTPADFDRARTSVDYEAMIATWPVHTGDVVFIPGGRVHALDAGCLVLEVQQNSDTTYRIHDWGRLDPDGHPRPLHVAQARQVMAWDDTRDPRIPLGPPLKKDGHTVVPIINNTWFRIQQRVLAMPWQARGPGDSFAILFVSAGRVEVTWPGGATACPAGSTLLVPAALPAFTVSPQAGPATVIDIRAGLPGG